MTPTGRDPGIFVLSQSPERTTPGEPTSARNDRPPLSPWWSWGTRAGFRFLTAFIAIVWVPETLSAAFDRSEWAAFKDGLGRVLITRILRLPEHSPAAGGGINPGGDDLPSVLAALFLCMVSVAVVWIWAAIGRSHISYPRLHAVVHTVARFSVAFFMLNDGFGKMLPSQFGPEGFQLIFLSQQASQLSPQGLLWAFMGASREYVIVTGVIEVAGGLLLLSRQMATAGALITVAAMAHVVVLNFAYDVAGKVLALQILLVALFVLAPELPRIAAWLIFNRPLPARSIPPLFSWSVVDIAARPLGMCLAVAIIWFAFTDAQTAARAKSQQMVRTPLHGMWVVEQTTSPRPWTHVVIPDRGTSLVISKAAAELFQTRIDVDGRTIEFIPRSTRATGAEPRAALTFRYEWPEATRLVLREEVDDQPVSEMSLRLLRPSEFPLVNHRHRWDW